MAVAKQTHSKHAVLVQQRWNGWLAAIAIETVSALAVITDEDATVVLILPAPCANRNGTHTDRKRKHNSAAAMAAGKEHEQIEARALPTIPVLVWHLS